MRLICPSCGAMHSAESWINDLQARQCLMIIGDLPHAVSTRCPLYLALFRPSPSRGLAWTKTLRLLSDLQEQIKQPHIQWEGKPARPNSQMAWAQAMERIIDRPPKSLPLKSHGYLRSIAYEIADGMDKSVEVKQNKAEKSGNFQRRESEPGQGEGLRQRTPEDFARMRQMVKKVGKDI